MKKKKIGFRPLALCYACLFYLFLYLPIAVVVVFSFNTSQLNVTFQGFTFEWYGRMFKCPADAVVFQHADRSGCQHPAFRDSWDTVCRRVCIVLNSEEGRLSAICCIFPS